MTNNAIQVNRKVSYCKQIARQHLSGLNFWTTELHHEGQVAWWTLYKDTSDLVGSTCKIWLLSVIPRWHMLGFQKSGALLFRFLKLRGMWDRRNIPLP